MTDKRIDNAHRFEVLIKRANKSMVIEESGMKAIMFYELGLRPEINEKQYQKELLSVKTKLTKTIDKFLKRALKATEKTQLKDLKPKIDLCEDSESLILIIDTALAITIDYRDF